MSDAERRSPFWRRGWEALQSRALTWLRSRILWVTDAPRPLDGGPAPNWAVVAIWGREHYRERSVKYPISKWSDAVSVARLERADRDHVLFSVGPWVDGQRVVTFYELNPTAPPQSLNALFWVPESLVLSFGVGSEAIACVTRASLRYFLSGGISQLAGGVINSPETFALANGVRAGWTRLDLDEPTTRAHLFEDLRRVPLGVWSHSVGPMAAERARELAAPILATIVAIWLASLVLTQAYLSTAFAWREFALQRLGSEVSTLLESQRRLDLLEQQRENYFEVAESRRSTLSLWAACDAIWSTDGQVRSMKWVDGSVSLNGGGPEATRLLQAVASSDFIDKAEFDSAVRESRGLQEFAIRFESPTILKPPPAPEGAAPEGAAPEGAAP